LKKCVKLVINKNCVKVFKKTCGYSKNINGKTLKSVGVHEFVSWDISVLACIKLYISITDQNSLRSYSDATFTHLVFVMCCL